MKKWFLIVVAIIITGCAPTEIHKSLYYRVSISDWESVIIRSAFDERIDLNAAYYYFDSYSQHQRGDKYVYFPVSEAKLLEGLRYRNSQYPFIINGNSNYRYIIKYSDIKDYIYTEGEER